MKRVSRSLLSNILSIVIAQAAFAAPIAASTYAPPYEFSVVEFINKKPESQLVIINGGKSNDFIEGMTFRAVRRAYPSMNSSEKIEIPTGILKAIQVSENQTIAQVIENGTELSTNALSRFSGVMAGDFISIVKQNIARRPMLLPDMSIEYRRIFDDPNAVPSSFELSEKGREYLAQETKVFAEAKMSRLIVEAYTDSEGPSDANQIESVQRAMTVRQYLIDELGFDAERVIALGYGEVNQISDAVTPESKVKNRRIVIKVLPAE